MRKLNGKEKLEAIGYFNDAVDIALNSGCLRSKCGSVIAKDGVIIGKGFNSPPNNIKLEKCVKDSLPKNFKSDRTCCIHAEQRAIIDALKNNYEKVKGSIIYFIRLDKENNKEFAGDPYCTICSKMALDIGIKEFVLWHKKGIIAYNTDEYNTLSFNHKTVEG
jgi:deoxycytidylate deaminase